jgi:hypothetical protein
MKLFSRLFLALGAFLLLSLAIYAWHSREYEGMLLYITVAVGALIVGGYGTSVVRRSRAVLTASPTDVEPATDESPGMAIHRAVEPDLELDEPHVGPTIWPVVFAASVIGIVIGTVGNRWVLVPGGILFLVAAVGWVRDVHRQWHHHALGLHVTHVGVPSNAEAVADDSEAVAAVPRQTGSPADDESTGASTGGNAASAPSAGDQITEGSGGAG